MRHPIQRLAPSPTAPAALLLALSVGCAADGGTGSTPDDAFVKAGQGKYDSSVESVIVNFEFDGEFLTDYVWNRPKQIEGQLLYTIGHLNGDRSVGRLDRVELSDIETVDEGNLKRVRYHAVMPVAWGKKNSIPSEYTFQLPLDVSYDGLEAFTAKHKDTCVDWSAHDVDSGSMWYYYRPRASKCALGTDELMTTVATVTVSTVNTTGKYPEYHKVWEDNALRVVAIFGKYEDGATETSDAGIANYNNFVAGVRERFGAAGLKKSPEEAPTQPGVAFPDITFEVELAGGRSVHIVALLVDNVREAGEAFDARYAELSQRADLISYNGHAGLGTNVRAMAQKGEWVAGQYVIVFQNGCDTYAYIDDALDEAHAAVNPDDPTGTRYIDTIVNAMPSYFHQGRRSAMALINGLLGYENPQTYEQIFAGIDAQQVVIVTGEHDNVFVPGYGGDTVDPVEDWDGLTASGTLDQDAVDRFETPVLPPGRYRFSLTGDGGDADLYVRVGIAPEFESWDCRPYRNGSSETCEVNLGSPAAIHAMVHGYEGGSPYTLRGTRLTP